MALQLRGFVDLPPHARSAGGFDHAAVDEATGRVYVAHTASDAIDVFDPQALKYAGSVGGLAAVAGALVANGHVFTSNRGENSVGILRLDESSAAHTVGVGVKPNGLAFDPGRKRLLVAHVGDPALPGSCTVATVDVPARRLVAQVPVAGRTRWTVYDPAADVFHVNIMDPPQIAVVAAGDPLAVLRVVSIPHAGPHGLDLDVARRRLYCACDAGVLVEVGADDGRIHAEAPIAGVPDVVFHNPALGRVYVAIGEPGVIEVFDTAPLRRRETVATEAGAHTLSFDAARGIVCAFLPGSCRAAVYEDCA